jgi:hypothetical protein
MFTRHFYRYDEVRAALLYAIMRGRPLEAAFWTQEWLDSGLTNELWATLIEAWLWFCLSSNPHWIMDHSKADPHLAAYQLAVGPKDNSLWAVLCLNPQEMPDTLCANVPPKIDLTRPNLERYLTIALHQRKGLAACWAALRLGTRSKELTYTSALCENLKSKLSPIICNETVLLCASVLWTCSSDVPKMDIPMSEEVLMWASKWSAIVGRRSRRSLAIPVECLYGITNRGCMSQKTSTIDELRTIHDHIIAEQGIRSDDDLEAFYAFAFPDDIPDEWSLEDQSMSHGPGVLRTGERLSLAKLGRIWFQAESRFAWGFYEWSGEDRVVDEGGCIDFQKIGENLNVRCDTVVDELLEPVRKLLIIA